VGIEGTEKSSECPTEGNRTVCDQLPYSLAGLSVEETVPAPLPPPKVSVFRT